LDKAITPVGTCTEMCPEFERVERIVQNMVDKTEKVDLNNFLVLEGMLRWC
jgi:nuclear mRNA export protein SAC3